MSLCPEEGKDFLKRYDQAGKAKWLILVIAAGILLLGVILYAGGRWLETRSVEEARGGLTQTEAVETQEYNGVTYQRREGLTSILVMGVDHDSAVESEGAYQGGQGDFHRLIVIDPERQSVYAGGTVSDHRRTQSGRGWLHGVLSGCGFHPAGRAGAVLGACGNELK